MTEELKPCPFCDITPLHIDLIVDPQWAGSYVLCGNCGARGPCGPHGSEDWVIKQWNARHEPDELPEWVKEAIENEVGQNLNKRSQLFYCGFVQALNWVLSLRKPEKK